MLVTKPGRAQAGKTTELTMGGIWGAVLLASIYFILHMRLLEIKYGCL